MAEILVKGKPWHYEATSYYNNDCTNINSNDATFLLKTTMEITKKHGITVFPVFGTLLGIIRENDFIKNDGDVDVAFMEKDFQRIIDLIPEFDGVGIKFARCSEPYVYTFEYNHTSLDFYNIQKAPWPYSYRYCKLEGQYMEKKYYKEFKELEFKGFRVLVPKDSESWLAYIYGKSWRIPRGGGGRIQSRLLFWFVMWRFAKRVVSYIKRHYLSKL